MKKLLTVLMIMMLLSASVWANGSKEITTDGVTKLRFMGYNSQSSRATYLSYLDKALPEIEISFEFVALDNFNNVLNSQLQAGQGPDIIEVGGEVRLLAKAGYLLDLTDKKFVSGYSQAGLTPYTVEGKVYATPLQSWYEGIFYNKAIFKKYGLAVPRTWDEFLRLHGELKSHGIKPQTMGAQSWEPMMKQSIGVVNNAFYADKANSGFDAAFDKGEAKLSDAWLPYVKEWARIIDEGYLEPTMLGLSYDQALDEFANGKAAMWECGPWAVNTIKEKNPNLDFGMFPIPGIEKGAGWLVGGPGSALAINAKSRNTEAALKVLEMTATAEAQKALVADNAGSSFLVGVNIDLGPIYADCAEAFSNGNVYAPWTSVWTSGNSIVEAYGKALQEVLAGTNTIEGALKAADAKNDTMRDALK